MPYLSQAVFIQEKPCLKEEAREKRQVVVLASGHDNFFGAASDVHEVRTMFSGIDFALARDWMRTPPYLYYNDIVADWHSIYRAIFSLCSRLRLLTMSCLSIGAVDAIRAVVCAPSRKISPLFGRLYLLYG